MKKLAIIALLFISINSFAQSLGGVTLKECYPDSKKNVIIENVKGTLLIHKLDDGTVYYISFIPSDDGVHASSITKKELINLQSYFTKKYNITFVKTFSNRYNKKDYFLEAYSKNTYYVLAVSQEVLNVEGYGFIFWIKNIKLEKKFNKLHEKL
jgi:hypothetical protein